MYMVPFPEAKDRGGKLVQSLFLEEEKTHLLERDMQ